MTRNDSSAAIRAGSGADEYTLLRIKRWLREHLGWNRIDRATSYLRSALWVVPILAVIAERISYRVLHFSDQWVTWDLTGLDVEGSRAMRQQLNLLDLMLPEYYKLPEDLALARIPDSQGLGGASGGRPSS